MENRKKRNLEIEKAKRKKQLAAKGIFAALVLVVALAVCYQIWDTINRRTIMTFNGERIVTSDFMLFDALNETPDVAMNQLKQTLVMRDKAAQHGFALTAEEMAQQIESAGSIREQMSMNFISEQRIAELFSIWQIAQDHLIDEYVDTEFEIDEEEFAEVLESQMSWILMNATDMEVKFILSNDEDELEDALKVLSEEFATFDEMVGVLCLVHAGSETGEIAVVSAMDFIMEHQAWANMDDILELEEGEIFGPFEGTEGDFFLVQGYTRVRNEEEIETQVEAVRENFINGKRSEVFFELVDEWVLESKAVVNNRAFSRF
jgi:hypothetical protein